MALPPLKVRPAPPAPQPAEQPAEAPQEQILGEDTGVVRVQVGKSLVLHLSRRIKRVSLANPAVAEIVLISPTEVLLNGQEPGETSLVLWDSGGVHEVHTLEVSAHRREQVLLEVTVVEVNRTALERHGIDFRLFDKDIFLVGRPARVVGFGEGVEYPPRQGQSVLPLTLGDSVTLALVDPDSDFSAFAEALQREGLARILAEPRLLARSGEEARFLAGGEIPIVIATALQTSVVFKEFGTRLSFTPTVTASGEIDLKLIPEVSEADFARGVTVAGSTIPSFVTRRAETAVRLRDGEMLVIAGLMIDDEREEEQKVPYLGDIPVLGYLFRRTAYERSRRELMVAVRPRIVGPLPPGTEVALPTARGPLSRGEVRTKKEEAEVTRPRVGLPGAGAAPHRAPSAMTPSPEWSGGQPSRREPPRPSERVEEEKRTRHTAPPEAKAPREDVDAATGVIAQPAPAAEGPVTGD